MKVINFHSMLLTNASFVVALPPQEEKINEDPKSAEKIPEVSGAGEDTPNEDRELHINLQQNLFDAPEHPQKKATSEEPGAKLSNDSNTKEKKRKAIVNEDSETGDSENETPADEPGEDAGAGKAVKVMRGVPIPIENVLPAWICFAKLFPRYRDIFTTPSFHFKSVFKNGVENGDFTKSDGEFYFKIWTLSAGIKQSKVILEESKHDDNRLKEIQGEIVKMLETKYAIWNKTKNGKKTKKQPKKAKKIDN